MADRSTNASRIGEIVEHRAIIWLAEQGYEVFRNFSRIGPVDLVVMDSVGQLVPIDVKKVVDGKRPCDRVFKPKHTQEQINLGVRFLYYNEKDDFFGWHIDDIYASLGRVPLTAQERLRPVTVAIDGIDVELTLTQVAEKFGINVRSLRMRRKNKPDETLEECVQHLTKATKRITVFGVEYPDMKAALVMHDISEQSVYYRMHDLKESLEQAITHFISKRKPHDIQNQGD